MTTQLLEPQSLFKPFFKPDIFMSNHLNIEWIHQSNKQNYH